jgi:tRNA (cytidine/uridine-2'-O-)-methyltransferase
LIRLALFQPDIPQNTGAVIRLAACFNIGVDIIEPCGFVLDDKRLKRAAMDYAESVSLTRHASWSAFKDALGQRRLVLFTTQGADACHSFSFSGSDTLLFGQESAGAPKTVHAEAEARIKIPMAPGTRSLNLAQSAAIAAAEALRQLNAFPDIPHDMTTP